jgi:hypothetical protein
MPPSIGAIAVQHALQIDAELSRMKVRPAA